MQVPTTATGLVLVVVLVAAAVAPSPILAKAGPYGCPINTVPTSVGSTLATSSSGVYLLTPGTTTVKITPGSPGTTICLMGLSPDDKASMIVSPVDATTRHAVLGAGVTLHFANLVLDGLVSGNKAGGIETDSSTGNRTLSTQNVLIRNCGGISGTQHSAVKIHQSTTATFTDTTWQDNIAVPQDLVGGAGVNLHMV